MWAFVALAAFVLAGDLFRANLGMNPAIPVEHAEQPSTGGLRYLEARRPNRFAGLNRPGIGQPLQPNVAMRYDLYDARGYDYPVVRRYDDFWRATAGTPGDFIPPTGRAQPTAESLRALSILSVTDVLQDPSDTAVSLPGLSVAYDGADARVYRNANALPRAFLVGGQRVVDGEERALAAVTAPGFDARREAITESRLPGLPASPARSPGRARLVRYDDEAATVVAQARAPASSCSPTCTSRAGRPRWTASRRRSSRSTTSCAACNCPPAPTGWSFAMSRRAGASAGSSRCSRWSCWWAWPWPACGAEGPR